MARTKKAAEVEHSKNFDKVKKYFDEGTWNEYRVGEAVKKNWITPASASTIRRFIST